MGDAKMNKRKPHLISGLGTINNPFYLFTKLPFTELLLCIKCYKSTLYFFSRILTKTGLITYEEIEATKSAETCLESQNWKLAVGTWVCAENAKY